MNPKRREQRRIEIRLLRQRIRSLRTVLHCLTPDQVEYQLRQCERRRNEAKRLLEWAERGEDWLADQLSKAKVTIRELQRCIRVYQEMKRNPEATRGDVEFVLFQQGERK